MKKIIRIPFCVALLLLLAGLVFNLSLLFPVPWLSDFTQQLIRRYIWFSYILSAVLFIFIAAVLVALVIVVSIPSANHVYVLPRSMGNIQISRQSIEKGAGITLEQFGDIKRYVVKTKGNLRPGKVKLLVVAETDTTEDFAALADKIQARVAEDMAASLDTQPQKINVCVKQYVPHQNHGAKSPVPRVR